MANVAKRFEKKGSPLTISWPSKALNRENSSARVSTFGIKLKDVSLVTNDGIVIQQKWLIPHTKLDLVGATITINRQTYKVLAATNLSETVQEVTIV